MNHSDIKLIIGRAELFDVRYFKADRYRVDFMAVRKGGKNGNVSFNFR